MGKTWKDIIIERLGNAGSTTVAAGKSIYNALGHDGTSVVDEGVYGAVKDLLLDNTDSISNKLGSYAGTAGVGNNAKDDLGVGATSITGQITAVDGKITTIDTVVDAIKAVTDLLPDAGALTSLAQDSTVAKDATVAKDSTVAKEATVGAPIKNSLASTISLILGDPGTSDISTLLSGIDSNVSSLQNNTTTSVSSQGQIFVKPDAGDEAKVVYVNLSDADGSVVDADSNEVKVVLTQADGTDVTARLYTSNALTTNLSNGGVVFTGNKVLQRDAVGRYFAYYKVTSTDVEEALNLSLEYQKAAATYKRDSLVQVREDLPETVAQETTLTAMKGATFNGTTDSLEAIANAVAALNNPTAAAITDAVWDELSSGHTTAGTFGKLMIDIKTVVDAISVPTAAANADAVWDETLAGHVTALTFGKAIADIETDATAIKVDTTSIESKVDVIDAFHDVPSADSADNIVISDVIGNKTDTSSGDSVVALLKAIQSGIASGTQGDLQNTSDLTASATTTEGNIFIQNTANHVYALHHMRLKSADPSGETVTVRLYEEVNGVSGLVDTFVIDDNNFDHNHSLMDMFGLPDTYGAVIRVSLQASLGSIAVTGQAVFSDKDFN